VHGGRGVGVEDAEILQPPAAARVSAPVRALPPIGAKLELNTRVSLIGHQGLLLCS
jgi:hypothetical protein